MGAGLAIIALIGGAVSVAIVGYHGIVLTFVTASVGGSMTTLLAAFLSDALLHRDGRETPSLPVLTPTTTQAEPAGPV